MSIENAKVVDFIGTEPDSGYVTLTATDHLEWGDRDHLMKLQDKINSYLAFIESGEIFDSYPNAKGKQLKLDVVCKYEPDEEAKVFFARCKEVITNAGFEFGYRVHQI
jgi:hypothetical protein